MNPKNFKSISTIVWDWNGTLLNDTDICIDCMNIMLRKRNISSLTKEKYKHIFTFPVKHYYEKAGFDFQKEAFEIPATEFIQAYNKRLNEAALFQEALDILNFLKGKKYRQVVLSAMKREELLRSIHYTGLEGFFDYVAGINDHYAYGKIDIALRVFKEINLSKDETCLIGDTTHDFETAQNLNIPCILVANGHQSYERLKNLNCIVVNELNQLRKYF